MERSVDQAFETFERSAAAARLRVVSEAHQRAFGSRLTLAARGKAELRLVWDGKEQYLSLEITHGRDTGTRAGWLQLYGATCLRCYLPTIEEVIAEFDSAIEYGITLLSPADEST
jgi:hypothetical protein